MMDGWMEDGDPLFEILLDAGVLPNRALVRSNFPRFVKEYDDALADAANRYFNDDTASEILTGQIKLRLVESMMEMREFEGAIDKAILELQSAKKLLNVASRNYQHNGLDRIQRILQYRKTYRGESY